MHRSRYILVAAALCSAPTAFGQAFATNHLGGYSDNSDALIMFDPANPADYTTIGSLGAANIGFGGLDFDANGNLWAYASYHKVTGGAIGGLYNIDISTGQATAVGNSFQSLQDLAYNPVDGKMYGINTQQNSITRLYEVDLNTGSTTQVGQLTGLTGTHYILGLGFDSLGNMYLHDVANDRILTGDGASMSTLYTLDIVTTGSQGLTIDWSRDDRGYHTLVGQGEFPNYISTVNSFYSDGSGYTYGPAFGPNKENGLPPVQAGDIAIMPIPAPATGLLAGLAGLSAARRRRR